MVKAKKDEEFRMDYTSILTHNSVYIFLLNIYAEWMLSNSVYIFLLNIYAEWMLSLQSCVVNSQGVVLI